MARTPTKSPTFQEFKDNLSKGQVAKSSDKKSSLPGRVASAHDTRTTHVHGDIGARGMDYLSNLAASGIEDEVNVEVPGYEPVPPTPENLPAIINKQVGMHGVHPKWHMVKHLPGYMQSAIRGLGRQIFKNFTSTPIEDIQVLSTLTNHDAELAAVGTWVKKNGHRYDQMAMQFERLFPGYNAEIHVWAAVGYVFVVVQDDFGKYIYSWPEDTSNRLR